MPKFAIASDVEQAKLSATASTTVDLTEYVRGVRAMNEARTADPRYSKWMRVDVTGEETAKGERRRFNAAATSMNLHLQTMSDERNDKVFWMRTRPAPVKRAKSNGK